MDEKEVKINLPIPRDHPHVFGQSVLTSDAFSFFGGFAAESASIKQQDELNSDIHNGTIYTFSNLNKEQIYKSKIDQKYTEIIGATTVFNEEIGISFTFGGLSLTENKDTKTTEFISTSNIYGHRWVSNPVKFENQIYFDQESNYEPRRLISSTCPVDNVFNAELDSSNVLNLHNYNNTYQPALSAEKPAPRYLHSAAWDQINNLMWIFGGLSLSSDGQNEYLNDLWTWSLYTGTWQKIETKNPPKPRIGSSMTFLNGILYLFGGHTLNYKTSSSQTQGHQISSFFDDTYESLSSDNDLESQSEYYFYYLDVSSESDSKEKFSELKWTPVLNLPDELKEKIYGSKILSYSPSDFQSYIIFSGGSLINIYDSVTNLTENEQTYSKQSHMTIISYNVQKKEFKVHQVERSIPEISYHSAAINKSGLLYVAGGIVKSQKSDTNYYFHASLRTVDISKFFCFPTESSSIIDRSILFEVTEIDSNKSDKIERSFYTEFLNAVKSEIQSVSSRKRVQQLYNDYVEHQTNHSPIDDFIVTGDGLFASKTVMEKRIGRKPFPSTPIGSQLIHDLVLYAYTDVIEPTCDMKNYDFYEFLAFIRFCRKRKLHRLIVFEIASYISVMRPEDFLSICIDCGDGFDGKPLFADRRLVTIRSLFARVVPRFHQLVDFSKIGKLEPTIARFILNQINGRKSELNFRAIPESEVENDLIFFEPRTTIDTKDGEVAADTSALEFDSDDIKSSKFEVIKAVMSSTFRPLFDIGDADDIFSAFKLVSGCVTPIDDQRLSKILNGCEPLFLDFAASHKRFKERLVLLLQKIEHPSVLEFALEMIGTNGLTVIVTSENKNLLYNSSFGSSLPPTTINVNASTSAVLALFVLMYSCKPEDVTGSEIEVLLPNFFNMHDLADEFLTVSATSYVISPCSLRRAVGDFIINQLLVADESNEARFLDLFPRLFDANLHEDAVKLVQARSANSSGKNSPARKRNQKQQKVKQFDPSCLAQLAADDQKYIEALTKEQLAWLIEKSVKQTDFQSKEQATMTTDSESDNEPIIDEISSFSK